MKKLILLTAMILMAACQTNTEPVMSDDEIKSALKENAVKLQDAILRSRFRRIQ